MPRRPRFTDEAILEALRAAALRCGEPLSHGRYDTVSAEVAGPSSARIIQRFGTWRDACSAAGVDAGMVVRQYDVVWGRDRVIAAVARYLASAQCPGTYAGYVEWAREQGNCPSGATVRNVLGGWSQAKSAAEGGPARGYS